MADDAPWDGGNGDAAPPAGQVIRNLTVTFSVAAVLATIFTAWAPASLDPGELVAKLISDVEEPALSVATSVPTPPIGDQELRVGIVSGHLGLHPDTGYEDSGAVCPDGLTEAEVNKMVVDAVEVGLSTAGFKVDVMEEFDPRLDGYKAIALISIHADTCHQINDLATGYKIAAALDTQVPDRAQRLVTCIADRYQNATGLTFHPNSITRDMTEYHTFYEIDRLTPAVIIETGYLYLDREILTKQPDKVARGIIDGVICYVNNEPAESPEGN